MNQRNLPLLLVVALLGAALFVAGLQEAARWVEEHRQEIGTAVLGVIALAGMGLIGWANLSKGFTGSIWSDPRFWAGCLLLAFIAIVAVVSLAGVALGWLDTKPKVVPVVYPSPIPIPQ